MCLVKLLIGPSKVAFVLGFNEKMDYKYFSRVVGEGGISNSRLNKP